MYIHMYAYVYYIYIYTYAHIYIYICRIFPNISGSYNVVPPSQICWFIGPNYGSTICVNPASNKDQGSFTSPSPSGGWKISDF